MKLRFHHVGLFVAIVAIGAADPVLAQYSLRFHGSGVAAPDLDRVKIPVDDGIEIYIAAEQPPGVPEENWLPVDRGDYDIDATMRIYDPDLERMGSWTAPRAEKLETP